MAGDDLSPALPANAQRLMEAAARDRVGHPGATKTMEELEALAGEV